MRHAAADNGIRQHATRCGADTAIVEERTAAPLGHEEFVGRRVEDDAGDDFAKLQAARRALDARTA